VYYDDSAATAVFGPTAEKCSGSGRAMVTMAVLSFLLLSALLALSIVRTFNLTFADRIPFWPSKRQTQLSVELLLSCIVSLFFVTMCGVWGAGCLKRTNNWSSSQPFSSSVTTTGFAYIVVCLFFMLAATGLIVYIVSLEFSGESGASSAPAARRPSGTEPARGDPKI